MDSVIRRSIPFSPPDITEAEIQEVTDALQSGWITTGPKTKELERLVATRCKTERAVCLNSNTACSELTLRLLGVGPGDEVIVPAYTYTATASVIAHVGATIVMVDCEKNSCNWDYQQLEDAITSRTKVIIPVDLFGIPADYDRIFKIIQQKKNLFHPSQNRPAGQPVDPSCLGERIQESIGRVIVMADSAHSFGAFYQGKPIGSVADFTNFSFHAVKNLTTAEGGAVVWRKIEGIDSNELYRQYMLFSLHGQSKEALAKVESGSWEYDVSAPLFKCNMTDVHAAIGLAQIRRFDQILHRKKQLIERYDKAFRSLPVTLLCHYTDQYLSSGHLYVVRLNDRTREQTNRIIMRLSSLGVAANVHYKPLPLLTAYRNLGFDINSFPNAFCQYENEISLPLYSRMTDEEADYVISCFIEAIGSL